MASMGINIRNSEGPVVNKGLVAKSGKNLLQVRFTFLISVLLVSAFYSSEFLYCRVLVMKILLGTSASKV